MSDKELKWLPYDLNNGPHDCRKKKNGNGQEITLEMVQRKLESIGITIDLNKLRNVCEIK